jgi:hypothetical protein
MKVLVLGYSKSGKSTAAEAVAKLIGSPPPVNTSDYLIRDFSESKGVKPEEILKNKDQYRQELYIYGKSRQATDPAYPVTEALKDSKVVTGIRPKVQLKAVRQLFDLTIWIDRPGISKGATDELGPEDADVVIANDGTFDDLRINLEKVLDKEDKDDKDDKNKLDKLLNRGLESGSGPVDKTVSEDVEIILNGQQYLLEKGDKIQLLAESTGEHNMIRVAGRNWELGKTAIDSAITEIATHEVIIFKDDDESWIEVDGKTDISKQVIEEIVIGLGLSPELGSIALARLKDKVASLL